MHSCKNFSLHKYFCFILFLYNVSLVYSQSCLGFHKKEICRVKSSSDFKQYGQARSAVVEIGKKYKYNTVLYGNKDYIINVCSEFSGNKIHFRILDKTTNVLIYDNTEDDYINGVAFSNDKTLNIEIELEILGDNGPVKIRGCAGIQILWRKISKIGFDN